MNTEIIIVVCSAVVPLLVVIVNNFSNRNVVKAKVNQDNIGGEKSAFDLYKDVLNILDEKERKFNNLNVKFDELNRKFDILQKESDTVSNEKEKIASTALKLMEDNKLKDQRITDLEERVDALETELSYYKTKEIKK